MSRRAGKLLFPMLPLERPAPNVKRFATFEVDLRARELRKGGIRIRLQDQPFEILAMMIERPGDVVTRDELRQRLWPAGTFVDFEHSLNAAIKRLRGALGDDADNPRFVETLHRRGYRFIAAVESEGQLVRNLHVVRPPAATRAAEAANLRLVVLPFANLSNDPAQEYFSDGLTEEMITQIGRLCPGRLGVIARTSSMLFKRSAKSASEIGRELAVDYLLEGSVRRDGDRIRITAQLIETRSELHLWAEVYDRRLEETLMLQSDVAERIARSLAMELVPDQHQALVRADARRSESYEAYLKGRYHWNRKGDEGLTTAIGYYERAIELDPKFASAYAAMARARVSVAYWGREPGRATLALAREAALKAIELDAGDSDPYVALAEVQRLLDLDWSLAETSYRKAVALAPSCEAARRGLAVSLASRSRFAEAKTHAEYARNLDPLCFSVNTSAAWVRYAAGEFDEAIDRCRYTLDMDPAFHPARRMLGAAYLAAGQTRQAIHELQEAVELDTGDPKSLAWLAHAKAIAGFGDEAVALVQKIEAMAHKGYVPAFHLALAHTGLGNQDVALALLEKACDDRDPAVINGLVVEPRLGPLRGDPRYRALLKRLQLPE